MTDRNDLRTPLARVRGLGSAKSGTEHFWQMRLTSVASIPLTIAFIFIVVSLLGRNQAFAQQILGTPLVAIVMLLFIITNVHHMWQGMQIVIEDYIHGELPKFSLLIANTLFCFAVGLACAYALFKLSFGL
ncbi:MAG: succinate dehydrogenase, hydrophobic membrane anchor protein [Xanthobacteraceae bacterium]